MAEGTTVLTRRTFIGLLGGVVVSATSPDVWRGVPVAPRPIAPYATHVFEVRIVAHERGLYSVHRAWGGPPLINVGMNAGDSFLWSAVPGSEIVLRKGEPSLVITGDCDWFVRFSKGALVMMLYQTHTQPPILIPMSA